jgi:tetratricopeptide (TPR) repeat protein
VVIALVAGSSFAASGADFYETLYQRGVSDFNEGKYEAARRELRIAAFGSIESVPRYETVHAYLVATARHLNADGDARTSLLRILNAEKIERRFATLSLPVPVREAIDTAARALLTREEAASLRTAPGAVRAAAPAIDPPPPPAPPSTAVAKPQPAAPANVVRTPSSSTSPDGWKMTKPAVAQPVAAPPVDIATQLRAGDAAIARGDLVAARAAYNAALTSSSLSHANALRIAEGLYRSRDFRGVVAAFTRAGALGRGEEPYRYYLAVALYESGQYGAAKRELTAVLPFIEVTPDVARYEAKIRAAIE